MTVILIFDHMPRPLFSDDKWRSWRYSPLMSDRFLWPEHTAVFRGLCNTNVWQHLIQWHVNSFAWPRVRWVMFWACLYLPSPYIGIVLFDGAAVHGELPSESVCIWMAASIGLMCLYDIQCFMVQWMCAVVAIFFVKLFTKWLQKTSSCFGKLSWKSLLLLFKTPNE